MTAQDDANPERSGIQILTQVVVEDSRDDSVDYAIGVECAAVGGSPLYGERTALETDRVTRSALNDDDESNDYAVLTFQTSESGEYLCRAFLVGDGNPPSTSSVVWDTYFRSPSLTMLLPPEAPNCINALPFEIRTVGQNVDGNQPIVNYTCHKR